MVSGKIEMYINLDILKYMAIFLVNTNCLNINYGTMDLIIMHPRVLRQKMEDESISVGWECQIVKNIRTLP